MVFRNFLWRWEDFCKMGIAEGLVENVDLLSIFGLVFKRHAQFQGCPFEILGGKQADPFAQIELSQVSLECFFSEGKIRETSPA